MRRAFSVRFYLSFLRVERSSRSKDALLNLVFVTGCDGFRVLLYRCFIVSVVVLAFTITGVTLVVRLHGGGSGVVTGMCRFLTGNFRRVRKLTPISVLHENNISVGAMDVAKAR